MDNLSIIRNSLKSNPNVVVVGEYELNELTGKENLNRWLHDARDLRWYGFQDHFIEFCIAPKRGLYDANSLNGFMDGLVPGLKANDRIDFVKTMWRLHFGNLRFYEEVNEFYGVSIGEGFPSDRVLYVTLVKAGSTDPLAIERAGLSSSAPVPNERGVSRYMRETKISIFPDKKLAKYALKGKESGYQIGLEELEQYKSSLLTRLANAF